jgi:hypothetical protein
MNRGAGNENVQIRHIFYKIIINILIYYGLNESRLPALVINIAEQIEKNG